MKKDPRKLNNGEIIIYKTPAGPELEVKIEKETIWLTQKQIAKLFNIERSVITKHLNNIFGSKELDIKSNVQKMHIANSDKPVNYYNLDVIISVGYRANSKRATQFRIWATKTLRNYLVNGYLVNKKLLLEHTQKFKELQSVISLLQDKSKHVLLKDQAQEILDLLSSYAKSVKILDQYDKNQLVIPKGVKPEFVIDYQDACQIIKRIKKELLSKREAGELFGQETKQKFESIINNLYLTFDRKGLYQSIEEKSAHLLYFTIKDHPFVDGNKRIASLLFIYFLNKNNYLYKETGERKINDNALAVLALLIAISDPKEKDVIIKIITNILK